MSYILRGTAMNGDVRIFAAITTEMVESARKIHKLTPTASAALGRFLTAGSIMGVMLKGSKDTLTLSINGGGEAGNLIVVSNSTGNVKGYISNPQVNPPKNAKGKLDVGGAIGRDGLLSVIKDLGLKEPYSSQVPIQTGEIGDDLAYYFTVSEQTPSAVMVGVKVGTDYSIEGAGGLIIQMLPGADQGLAEVITYRLEEIPPLSTLIGDGKTGEEILNMLFDDMGLKILDRIEVDYVCDCSRERVEKALISMGREELESIKEEENIEIQCHFCNTAYNFTREDIEALINS